MWQVLIKEESDKSSTGEQLSTERALQFWALGAPDTLAQKI